MKMRPIRQDHAAFFNALDGKVVRSTKAEIYGFPHPADLGVSTHFIPRRAETRACLVMLTCA
jgi:hypothetical protein